jgi:hypothetical protein
MMRNSHTHTPWKHCHQMHSSAIHMVTGIAFWYMTRSRLSLLGSLVRFVSTHCDLYSIEVGYRVAQARIFFKLYLPPDPRVQAPSRPLHGSKRPRPVKLGSRTISLAYVQYFLTPRRPEPDILMYRVSREDPVQNPRRGTVIPIDSISRFIQLVPRFDGRVSSELTPETSMEIARNYYVNSFATHQIYQSVY